MCKRSLFSYGGMELEASVKLCLKPLVLLKLAWLFEVMGLLLDKELDLFVGVWLRFFKKNLFGLYEWI